MAFTGWLALHHLMQHLRHHGSIQTTAQRQAHTATHKQQFSVQMWQALKLKSGIVAIQATAT
jgi:hypothetical protein